MNGTFSWVWPRCSILDKLLIDHKPHWQVVTWTVGSQ